MTGDLVPSEAALSAKQSADVLTALDLPALFNVADWRLVLAADGWYLLAGQTAQRITVDVAVRKLAENPQVGKLARRPCSRRHANTSRCSGRNWRPTHGSALLRAIHCKARDSTRSKRGRRHRAALAGACRIRRTEAARLWRRIRWRAAVYISS